MPRSVSQALSCASIAGVSRASRSCVGKIGSWAKHGVVGPPTQSPVSEQTAMGTPRKTSPSLSQLCVATLPSAWKLL